MRGDIRRERLSKIALAFDHDGEAGITRVIQQIRLNQSTRLSICATELAKELFFGSAASLVGIVGTVHPFLAKGTIHPSTSDALTSIIWGLNLAGIERVPEGTLTATSIKGSAAILGGPVANLHARLLFGTNGYSPLLGVQLPIFFDYVPQLHGSMTSGVEKWKLIVDGSEVDSECLLITSLPCGNEGRITNFAGLHGAGTRAVHRVLQNEFLLSNLYRKTRSLSGWQALIPVTAKDHETPLSVGEPTVVPIEGVDFDEVQNSIRVSMVLSDERIAELMELLPDGKQVEFSSPLLKDVLIILEEERHRRLNYRRKCERLYSAYSSSIEQLGGLQSSVSISEAPGGASGKGAQPGTPRSREVQMRTVIKTPPSKGFGHPERQAKRRRGRPSKEDRASVKSFRFDLRLGQTDVDRLERLASYLEAPSMAEVIRLAIREYEHRLFGDRVRPKYRG
jgi:hypothetical protein